MVDNAFYPMHDSHNSSDSREPTTLDEVVAAIKSCHESDSAIYPVGGGTGLAYGTPPAREGVRIDLKHLNRLIDYPSRDMTVTVEAGMTFQSLADLLKTNQQQIPLDVPQPDQATLGGVIATNVSGARRYGYGTMRDYLIGVQAVDARGDLFKGGGRVVKNVAGYDFCKLLTGSLGTLGIITQATFKLKPISRTSILMACPLADWELADRLLERTVHSETTPTAVEIVCGGAWRETPGLQLLWERTSPAEGLLILGLEGTDEEVAWMRARIRREWKDAGVPWSEEITDQAPDLWRSLAQFQVDDECPLILKISCVPSAVTTLAQSVLQLDADCSLQIHAGDGVLVARMSEFPGAGLAKTVLASLVPLANQNGGNVVVLSNPSGRDMTHQSVWGGIGTRFDVMTRVKQQFDPDGRLNPGRFVYLGGL